MPVVPQVDGRRQFQIAQVVLDGYRPVFPGVVHVPCLQQGNQLHRLRPNVLLGSVFQQALCQPRLPVVGFRQLQNHQRTIAAGVDVGIGMAPGYVRAVNDLIPVVRGNLPGMGAAVGIAKNHPVAGKPDVPGSKVRDQQFVDDLVIRRGHDVAGLFQLGDFPGAFLAAGSLPQYVDLGITGFKSPFDGGHGHRQTPGMKNNQLAGRLGRSHNRQDKQKNQETNQTTLFP